MIYDIVKQSGGFDLRLISGLSLWLDFSSTNFLSLDGVNGISTCLDRSTKAYSCFQTDSTKRPIYTPNLLNGLGGIIYDGTNDCLLINSFEFSAFTTIFHVVKPSSIALNKPFVLEHSANTNSNNGFFVFFSSGPDTSIRRAPNINSNSTTPTNQMNLTSNILSTHIFDGSLDTTGQIVRIRKDKTELTTFKHVTNSNITVSNTKVTSTLNIGARNNGTFIPTSGTLYELVMFDRVLSEFEIFLVENYLYNKYFV